MLNSKNTLEKSGVFLMSPSLRWRKKLTLLFGFDIIKIMEKIDTKKVIKYWQVTAEHDYDVMLYLFKEKNILNLYFSDILFWKKY